MSIQTLYVILNYRLLVRTLFGPCLNAFLAAVVPAEGDLPALTAALHKLASTPDVYAELVSRGG